MATASSAQAKARQKAVSPVPRPDRKFYAATHAFGRFGMRWFDPQIMPAEHYHGHIELNWLTAGSMDYLLDGKSLSVPSGRLVMFWAGIPHRTVGLDRGAASDSRQCNVYLPLDTFLHMPRLGRLTETMMAGGVIALSPDTIGNETLRRWYEDYRSGDAERTDILKSEIAIMFRRASMTGWDELLEPWIESVTPTTKAATPLRYAVAMIKYVLEHLAEPLPASDVAEIVGLHPNYALNLFTSVMNVSLHKFVVRMRLIRARSLLFETSLSIENIAFHSGFTGKSQFYEQFREAYGISPREMRTKFLAHA
ncbi:MAG: helix-turn-helix domain-containing protein [Devosia sp.]